VNSAHHQAVKDVSARLVVNARAEDGLIEGIESPAHRFALGVQWHPEYAVDPADPLILRAFVEACHG
jgi:putative glutamine amidotransferase